MPKDSPVKTMAELKGKRVASGPGIQNVTLAKTMLERAGAGAMSVTELPIGQHVAAIAAGQIDAVYTLEPTGTVGRLNGTTRVLEAGVVAHYILGDPMAPWHGGSASLTTEFIKKYPAETKKFIAAYARGIELVRTKPDEARQFMKGYTAIEGALTAEVPLAVVHAVQRVQGERRRLLPEVLRPVLRQGHLREARRGRADAVQGLTMADTATTTVAAPWTRRRRRQAGAARASTGSACCRSSARWCCSSPGTSSCALGCIKPILLPTPSATLGALFSGLAGGPLLHRLRASPCCARSRRS